MWSLSDKNFGTLGEIDQWPTHVGFFPLSLHSIQVLFSIRSAFKTAAPLSDYYILLQGAYPGSTPHVFPFFSAWVSSKSLIFVCQYFGWYVILVIELGFDSTSKSIRMVIFLLRAYLLLWYDPIEVHQKSMCLILTFHKWI